VPNSDLLYTTSIAATANPGPMMATRTWDDGNRLKKISTVRAGVTEGSHEWVYDAVGRREKAILTDADQWTYGYNERNEVISGVKESPGAVPRPGYALAYTFDAIGNRLTATTNGQTSVYTSNALNQYEQGMDKANHS